MNLKGAIANHAQHRVKLKRSCLFKTLNEPQGRGLQTTPNTKGPSNGEKDLVILDKISSSLMRSIEDLISFNVHKTHEILGPSGQG